MNKEILMAMKWLENSELVTQEELEDAHNRAVAADNEAERIADTLLAGALQDGEDAFNIGVDKADTTYCIKRITRAAKKNNHRGATAWLGIYFSLYSTITRQTYINCIKYGSSNVPEA